MTRNSAHKSAASEGVASIFRTQHPAGVEELPTAKSIAVKLIDANPFQPRRTMDPDSLKELARSIRDHGVLQPLVVRRVDQRYQIIAGERRLRAATMAGLQKVPCVTRTIADDDMEVLALLENIQRADLDTIDEAHAYQRLMERLGGSLRELAARVHKSHEHIAGRLRLIADPAIEDAVRTGTLGPTVAQELARVTEGAHRQDLLERAAQGERITVEMVKQTRPRPPHGGGTARRPDVPAMPPHPRPAPAPDADMAHPVAAGAAAEVSNNLTAAPPSDLGRRPSSVLPPASAAAPDASMTKGEQGNIPSAQGTEGGDDELCRAEDSRTVQVFQAGNGNAPRAAVRAALLADLAALDAHEREIQG